MYCRTCGSRVNDNAEICVKCGCRPLSGKAFCQNCGTKTFAQQAVCTKCGISLKSLATANSTKGATGNAALKIIGNILVGIGIFMFALMVWHIGDFVINTFEYYKTGYYGYYDAVEHGAFAIRCLAIGLVFFVPGRICKKKSNGK